MTGANCGSVVGPFGEAIVRSSERKKNGKKNEGDERCKILWGILRDVVGECEW